MTHILVAAPAEGEDARQAVADWMMDHSIATGHGDTTADLLSELAAHCRNAGWDDAVKALREYPEPQAGFWVAADWLAANKSLPNEEEAK